MSITFKKIDIEDFLEMRKKFLENYKNLDDFDLDTAIRFHKSLPDYKNFQKMLEKSIQDNRIATEAYSKETLLEDLIKNLNSLHRVGQADFLSVIIDSHTRENHYENARTILEDSIKSNKSLLNGFPLIGYGIKLARKIINDVEVPLQIKHGSADARLLAEFSFLGGFSAFDGGGISHNIPFSKSVPLKDSLENWKYVDRLVGFYEEHGVKINREIFSPLTATLVPPAISNSIQILETLLAVEQGVKNITIGVAQYGNITQDIASLLALQEQIKFYLDTFSFKDINISTVFNQWIGGFPENELKAYSLISYSATVALFTKANRIFIKNIDEYSKNSLDNTMINSLVLTKTILDIGNNQKINNYEEIIFEKEQIKKETAQIITKIFSNCDGDLRKAIVEAFEYGEIDVPFAPSKYNLGKMMPARDSEGMIRYLDIGNLPFCSLTKEFHYSKIKERALSENRKIDFQMTIDDIFAMSQGKLINKKSRE
ncbi:methylaspartate mutase subunit E [Fusobacterium pseudoperiodonticum]|uniref:Glutamate mutase epsilon subunit n=1 Tax=Fusobacterium pseudoperiodonticum TaxID=2663009 RepID=A0AAD0AS55_9FUSO|nr:methylaspartate mutase subunit E [Fusobacterium pseudoperiodonticum]ATV66560.1 methylaspartate mutase subunit E [Fusobacterium pseudoperiodonticum]